MKLFRSAIFLLLFLATYQAARGQYTYLEGSFGYSVTKFEQENSNRSTASLNSFSLHISATRRIVRPIGLGLDIELPFFQTNKTEFVISRSSNFNSFTRWESVSGNFEPSDHSYSLSKNIVPRLMLKIYFGDGYDDFYFEGRFGLSSIREEMVVKRDGFVDPEGNVFPAVDIDYKENLGYRVAGFAGGYQSTSDNGWFFRVRTGVDFLNIGKSPLDYTVAIGYLAGEPDDVRITSIATEASAFWFVDLGTGFYF